MVGSINYVHVALLVISVMMVFTETAGGSQFWDMFKAYCGKSGDSCRNANEPCCEGYTCGHVVFYGSRCLPNV